MAVGIVCTSVNLTSYTMMHEYVLEKGFQHTPAVDMTCALASGFLSALAMNPLEVVRTRLFAGTAQGGMARVAFEIMKHEQNGVSTNEKGGEELSVFELWFAKNSPFKLMMPVLTGVNILYTCQKKIDHSKVMPVPHAFQVSL